MLEVRKREMQPKLRQKPSRRTEHCTRAKTQPWVRQGISAALRHPSQSGAQSGQDERWPEQSTPGTHGKPPVGHWFCAATRRSLRTQPRIPVPSPKGGTVTPGSGVRGKVLCSVRLCRPRDTKKAVENDGFNILCMCGYAISSKLGKWRNQDSCTCLRHSNSDSRRNGNHCTKLPGSSSCD